MTPRAPASIQRKLRIIMMLTSGAALLIASIGFVAYDLLQLRRFMAADVNTLAEMVGNLNTAALTFNDPGTANENLHSLRDRRSIISAVIYDKNGDVFAAYPTNLMKPVPLTAEEKVTGTRFGSEFLEVRHPIVLQRDILGYVILRSDLSQMQDRISQHVRIILLLIAIAGGLAYFLTSGLQRVISRPILALVDTTKVVSKERDYSVRAASPGTSDEIAVLVEAFNEMLGQIQTRDAELASARDHLEKRVEERTAELQRQMDERSRAETALRDSEERFRSLVQSAHDAIILADEEGMIISWNSGAQKIFQYSGEEILGQPISTIVPERYREAHLAGMRSFRETGRYKVIGKTVELHGLRKDGTEIPIDLSISTWKTGGTSFFSSIIRDITERKRAVEQLREFAAKLERSNRELQDFAYVASHDLQEPLRKVQAFGDRLKSKYSETLGTEGLDYLDRMQNAAARMQNLINDLLLFSRVTTKPNPFTQVDLNAIVRDVLNDLEVRIQQTQGKVSVESLPSIEADPLQMRQLFQNLLGNALKFHQAGTPPVVSIKSEIASVPTDPANRLASDSQMCHITVQDNGIGFDEKYLSRIFAVFQRLHGRGTYEGTGIGLAICRKIVERHNGSITARSAAGQGAAFIVTLPLIQTKGESA